MSHKLLIRKRNGEMYPPDKRELGRRWKELEDGDYEFFIKKVTKGNTRYRFYFDAVMYCILAQAGDFFHFPDGKGGTRPVMTEEEVHLIMKLKYNPIEIVDRETGEITRIPATTTMLSDTDFISRYEEQIIADFSGPPFNVEFPTFEKWRELRSGGAWYEWKEKVYGPQ